MAAVALVLPGAGSGPALATEGDGRGVVVVKVLDPAGQPVNGQVWLLEQGATGRKGPASATTLGTYTFDVPVGRYGVLAVTPWGGFNCAGISPCDYYAVSGDGAGVSPVTGALTVTDSETPLVHTVQLADPAVVTGTGVVGQPLTLTWSPQMTGLLAASGAYTGGVGAGPRVQWLRDDAPVAGAYGLSYTPTGTDVGRMVSVRLDYPVQGQWTQHSADPSPRFVPGRRIAKLPSRTTVSIFRKKVLAGRSPGLRVDVTAADLPATGRVSIKVGKHVYSRPLRNGVVRLAVPSKLRPGRYRVVASYPGSSSYAPSTGTGRFTVIRKR